MDCDQLSFDRESIKKKKNRQNIRHTPFFKIIPRRNNERQKGIVAIFAKWKIAIRNLALGGINLENFPPPRYAISPGPVEAFNLKN